VGLGILERTRILNGISTHFMDFGCETKRFVGGSLNVILTRQTCSQRSSKPEAAEIKTPSARKLFSRTNLLYVPKFKMYRRLRSRSVHVLGTCEQRTAAQCQIPIFSAGETRFFSEDAKQRLQIMRVSMKS